MAKDPFFNPLVKIADNVRDAAKYFVEQKVNNLSDLKEFARIMKDYEDKGDTYLRDVVAALSKTFITPIEREDIHYLALHMDDVLNSLEQCAAQLEMYSLADIDDHMRHFAENIYRATMEMAESIHLLADKKFKAIHDHSVKIKSYESKCDEIFRVAIKNLFDTEQDAIRLIKLKETYETLENAADECYDVSTMLESIIMSNS